VTLHLLDRDVVTPCRCFDPPCSDEEFQRLVSHSRPFSRLRSLGCCQHRHPMPEFSIRDDAGTNTYHDPPTSLATRRKGHRGEPYENKFPESAPPWPAFLSSRRRCHPSSLADTLRKGLHSGR